MSIELDKIGDPTIESPKDFPSLHNSNIDKLELAFSTNDINIQSISGDISGLQSISGDHEIRIINLEINSTSLITISGDHEERIVNLEGDVTGLIAISGDHDGRIVNLEDDITGLVAISGDHEERIVNLEDDITGLVAISGDHEERIVNLEGDVTGLIAISGDHEERLDNLVTSLITITGNHEQRLNILETKTTGITGGLTQLDNRYVNNTGDTINGNLRMNGDLISQPLSGAAGSGKHLISVDNNGKLVLSGYTISDLNNMIAQVGYNGIYGVQEIPINDNSIRVSYGVSLSGQEGSPVISLISPTSGSTLQIVGIYNSDNTGFNVALSSPVAESGYKISWNLNTFSQFNFSMINQNIIPEEDVTYDLGSPSRRWRDLYLSGNTMYIGNQTISVIDTISGGDSQLSFGGQEVALYNEDGALPLTSIPSEIQSGLSFIDTIDPVLSYLPDVFNHSVGSFFIANETGTLTDNISASFSVTEGDWAINNGITWKHMPFKIPVRGITSAQLKIGAVQSDNIYPGAVIESKIANDSIGISKLKAEVFNIENFSTTETNVNKVLRPDGAGGFSFGTVNLDADILYAQIADVESSLYAISSNLQTQIDNLDFTYATDAILNALSGDIQEQISNLSGNFLGLTDTPNSYSGANGYLVAISGDRLYFKDPATIITDTSAIEADIIAISGNLNTLETYTTGITGGLAQLDNKYVNVTGDTMTGNLNVSNAEIIVGQSGTSFLYDAQDEFGTPDVNLSWVSNHFENNLIAGTDRIVGKTPTGTSGGWVAPLNSYLNLTDSNYGSWGEYNALATVEYDLGASYYVNEIAFTIYKDSEILRQITTVTLRTAPSSSGPWTEISSIDMSTIYTYANVINGQIVRGTFPTGATARYVQLSLEKSGNNPVIRTMSLSSNIATSNNTVTTDIIVGSGIIDSNSLVVENESAIALSDAQVNVAYSIDSGAFSSLVSLNTFKALGLLTYTTSFQVKVQPVASNHIASVEFNTIQTATIITQNGIEAVVNSVRKSFLTNSGQLELDDSTTPDAPTDGIVLYSNGDTLFYKNSNSVVKAISKQWAIKTGDYTAVAGDRLIVNTSSVAITITLPAGVPGDEIIIKDYASTFPSNNCILDPDGTQKVMGSASNYNLTAPSTLVYVDDTRGWII